jgi:hypothetical protein
MEALRGSLQATGEEEPGGDEPSEEAPPQAATVAVRRSAAREGEWRMLGLSFRR